MADEIKNKSDLEGAEEEAEKVLASEEDEGGDEEELHACGE